jgi:hypothetical protein
MINQRHGHPRVLRRLGLSREVLISPPRPQRIDGHQKDHDLIL